MIVKIGNTFTNSEDEPVLIILSDREKLIIERMAVEHDHMCFYPEDADTEKVQEFMRHSVCQDCGSEIELRPVTELKIVDPTKGE